MLAVSSLINSNDERQEEMESSPIGLDDFSDVFSGGNSLEGFDFDDHFIGIDDGDVYQNVEMDTEKLAEFSVSGGKESEMNASISVGKVEENERREDEDKGSSSNFESSSSHGDKILSEKRNELVHVNLSPKEVGKGRKSSTQSKGSQGKGKMKVDWTPDLHRRFVQAVEQLGVDKAVPSRILELMGIDCLTRHNIASHLQKYRTHRKHLLVEAASWSHRQQPFGGGGGTSKRDMSPWLAPTIGVPPPTPLQTFRPLHVWGHPTLDQSLMHMWPNHLVHSLSPPPPPWAPPVHPPPDPSYWHPLHQQVSNAPSPWNPCFPQPLATMRFSVPVRGIPPHAMCQNNGAPSGQSDSYHPVDFHPSKESIDAAFGDVLSKPLLPFPLGLKSPSLETIVMELEGQGISKIPPTCS